MRMERAIVDMYGLMGGRRNKEFPRLFSPAIRQRMRKMEEGGKRGRGGG